MKKGTVAVISGLLGGAIGGMSVGKHSGKVIEERDKKVNKFKSYYNMLNQWLYLKQEGKGLDSYFKDKQYSKIAVYGLGEMGVRLIDELRGSDVQVVYGSDKDVDNVFTDIKVYSADELDTAEDVDVIVVTAIFAFDEIEEQLQDKVNCSIVSLEDVVFEA